MSERTGALVRLAVLFAILLAHPGAASAQSVGAQLRPLLHKGRFTAQELQPWSPPRYKELGNRLYRATLADPAWAQERKRQGEPGKPLPYDPKTGLTEEEYQEFLHLQSSLEMKPFRTVQIVVEPTANGWRLGKATTAAELRGVEIDTLANKVRTSYGEMDAGESFQVPNALTIGPWGGIRWNGDYVMPPDYNGTVVQLAVGKLAQTGQTVIYLETRRVEGGAVREAKKSVFRLEGPSTATKRTVSKKTTARRAR